MRIRNAAIAGATALAVAFGGTTVASAEDTAAPKQEQSSNANGSSNSADKAGESNTADKTGEDKDAAKGASLSSKINTGLNLEGDKEADGQKIFGSSKDLSEQPKWAKVLYGTTIATAIATLIGMVVGPLANFVQFGPFSR